MKIPKQHLLERILATGFLSGYFPVGPGTVGSLLGLLILLFVPIIQNHLLIASLVILFVGIWVSTVIEASDGKDASIINIDEICGMWISLLFLPLTPFWIPLLGFLFFRIFDIWKPYPINKLQDIKGGWGVMLDDVAAGILANLLLRSILIYL